MIQICKMCGSKYEDKVSSDCPRCGGDKFTSFDGTKKVFDTVDQIDVAIEEKNVEYEGMNYIINIQRDKALDATYLLAQLETEEHECMEDYYELTHLSHNIKQRKKILLEEAKRLEEEVPIIKM